MKISVKSLRIAMIAVNLVLALGFTIHYGYSMHPDEVAKWVPFLSAPDAKDETNYRQLGMFKFKGPKRRVQADPGAEVRVVGVWLQPNKPKPPPPPPPPKDPEDVPKEEPGDEDQPTEGGPLADKGWAYVFAILTPENPRESRVILEKKNQEAGSGSSTKTGSVRSRFQSKSSSKRGSSRYSKGRNNDSFVVYLNNYHYQDEDRELDFWVHDVNHKHLVYWMDGKPKERYFLMYDSDSWYLEKTRDESLIEEKEEEKDDEDGEEEKEKPFFRVVRQDIEDRRAEEYKLLSEGKRPQTNFIESVDLGDGKKKTGFRGNSSRSRYGARSSGSSKSSGTTKTSPYKKTTSTKKTETTPKSKEEQMKKLGSTMKAALDSDKVSEKDKKDLRKLENMIKGDPNRRSS